MYSIFTVVVVTHSGSADGTLRYWEWTTGATKDSIKHDRLHVVDSGENISKIAKRYACTVQQLLLWNGIRDARQVSYLTVYMIMVTFVVTAQSYNMQYSSLARSLHATQQY
jgi:LysM domain